MYFVRRGVQRPTILSKTYTYVNVERSRGGKVYMDGVDAYIIIELVDEFNYTRLNHEDYKALGKVFLQYNGCCLSREHSEDYYDNGLIRDRDADFYAIRDFYKPIVESIEDVYDLSSETLDEVINRVKNKIVEQCKHEYHSLEV